MKWGRLCAALAGAWLMALGTSIFTEPEITAAIMVMLLSLQDHGAVTLFDVGAVVVVTCFLKVCARLW